MRIYILIAVAFLWMENVLAQTPKNPELVVSKKKNQESFIEEKEDSYDKIDITEWNRKDWEILKPEYSIIEISGYFRFRSSTFKKLDLGNSILTEQTQLPLYLSIAGDSDTKQADYPTTDMRLRIEPQINITDNVRIITTFDIFDNLLLGSTPDTFLGNENRSPTYVNSKGQIVPTSGQNSIKDSIQVKRAYAEVTFLDEYFILSVGRMPEHWGLGMLNNSGDCLDCDSGDVVDRISIGFKIADYVIRGLYDFVSTGPLISPFGANFQSFDAVNWDDVSQFAVRIQHIDHSDDINILSQDKYVYNYGLFVAIRNQPFGLSHSYYQDELDVYSPTKSINDESYKEVRNARLYTADIFFKFYSKHFRFMLESAFLFGSFEDTLLSADNIFTPTKTRIQKFGAVIDAEYSVIGNFEYGAFFNLKSGIASGDKAQGFGSLLYSDTQRSSDDTDLKNFQFNPNYHVDMLLFRRIIGTVTDALYISPQFSYLFSNVSKIYTRIWAVYSQALFIESTPSFEGSSPSKNLGLEIDGELGYGQPQKNKNHPFRVSFAGGFLLPFSGLSNASSETESKWAWTLQARLYFYY